MGYPKFRPMEISMALEISMAGNVLFDISLITQHILTMRMGEGGGPIL